jgi:signal transduction histidine kinase
MIIEFPGGKIWVECDEAKDATLTFTLPLQPDIKPEGNGQRPVAACSQVAVR